MPAAQWDPRGDVLFVGRGVQPETVAFVRSRLGDCEIVVLDLDDPPIGGVAARPEQPLVTQPEAIAGTPPTPRPAAPVSPVSDGFPPESDAAVAAIEYLLARNPHISSLLADNRWAARDIWRVVRDRPRYFGFTHIDNLERSRRSGVQPDVGPKGRRHFSHRFAFEFGAEQPLEWRSDAKVRLLIGPGNQHGRASSWARVARSIDGVDAVALSIGPQGFAAELMATPADWETAAVRDQILSWVGSATHVIVDDAADELRAAVRAAAHGRVIRAGRGRIPVVAPPTSAATLARLRKQPHAVVIGRGRPELPASWRVTRLSRVPRSLWVLEAMNADVVVDTREPPRLDMPVVTAMSGGAVLVADLPRRIVPFRSRIPHLRLRALPDVPDADRMQRLAAASRRFTQEHHSDRVVAKRLQRALRVA